MNDIQSVQGGNAVDFSKMADKRGGFSGIDTTVLRTPFLRIAQDNTPEAKKSDPAYVPGLEPGMFYNTSTKKFSQKAQIIVIKAKHEVVVWKPNRGGLAGRYPIEMLNELTAVQDKAKRYDAEGNSIQQTITLLCIEPPTPGKAAQMFLYSLSSTEYKFGKDFLTKLWNLEQNGQTVGVEWAAVWELSSGVEKNNKGSWFSLQNNTKFIRFVTVDEAQGPIAQALELADKVQADYSWAENQGGSGSGATGAAAAGEI